MLLRRFFFISFVMLIAFSYGQSVDLMTYNIRYNSAGDGENKWEYRKQWLAEQVTFYQPDVIGVQEATHVQMQYIDSVWTGYSFVGVGRDDGKTKGEYSAIFYDKARFQLLGQDTFWLSDTPDEISVGWDAAMERICTYALLFDKESGKSFWVFNTHFDHIGKTAREKSAQLILDKIKQLNVDKLPVVLMGDLNLRENTEPIQLLSRHLLDTRIHSEAAPFGPEGTFTGFDYSAPMKHRIDYIFSSTTGWKVLKYGVIADPKNGRFPSDHFPVLARLEYTTD